MPYIPTFSDTIDTSCIDCKESKSFWCKIEL